MMVKKKFYYSEDEKVEEELLELFGVPDEEYDKAFILCCALPNNYDAYTTEELYKLIKPLEDDGYFVGNRATREFFIEYIKHIKDKGKDCFLYQEEALKKAQENGWLPDYSGKGVEHRQNTPYDKLK